MITHVWTVICRESMLDETSNNISLLEAYENLQFDVSIPEEDYKPGMAVGVTFSFELVSLFFRERKGKAEDVKATLIILDPKGQKLGEAISDIQFQADNDRMRNIMKFENMTVTSSGTYLFQVYMSKSGQTNKKEPVAVVPMNVGVTINGKLV